MLRNLKYFRKHGFAQISQTRSMMDQQELHERLKNRKWYDGLLPAVIGVAGISGAFIYFNKISQEQTKILKQRKKEGQVQSYGKPLIGGPFELVRGDTDKPCTEQILKDKWTLLYFGFNFCPDVCPDEMEKVADANRLLTRARSENQELYDKEKIHDLQCVYISIDPKRDTPKKADSYRQVQKKKYQKKLVIQSVFYEFIFHLMSRQNLS